MGPTDYDDIDEVEWDDQLQDRLDALDREGPDPRPWREVLAELRESLANRRDGGTSDVR
jgi:hypothetical protein